MGSVLLSKSADFNIARIAELLGRFYKIPLVDAAQMARKGWGILAENLSEAKAAELRAIFSEAGIVTHMLQEQKVPALPPAELINTMVFKDGQLFCISRDGKSFPATPVDLNLLAACAFHENRSVTVKTKEGPSTGQRLASMGILLTTGLPIKIGGKERTVEKTQSTSELVFYLDLFWKDSHKRVAAHHFDYAFLGGQKQFNVTANFKVLLKVLAEFSARTPRNRGMEILLAGKPISDMGYRSLDDFDHENRWLLSLRPQ